MTNEFNSQHSSLRFDIRLQQITKYFQRSYSYKWSKWMELTNNLTVANALVDKWPILKLASIDH